VFDQRIHHVAQHSKAVRASAIKFTKSVSVAHGAFLSIILTRSRIRYCALH
jgi:hypothetical protein